MVLQETDFAAMRINWTGKVENLRAIAAELSLGLDAFVFVDDSSVERELVRAALPEVGVPDFPADSPELPAWFRQHVARRYFRRHRPGRSV
jgi:predicted enzyme involved in methoxymalonyl-ACP biosynthesis